MKAFVKEHKYFLGVLLVLSIAIMIYTGYHTNKLGHDMAFHVNNIENLASYLDFSKGHFLAPDISENIGGDLGYGLYLFYPSLPHLLYAYFYKFVSLFSMDIFTSILLFNTILTIVSTFLMYLLSYKLSGSKKVAFLTGLIFLLFPYRISNIFLRYALNESLLFVFIPLILLGLYEWKEGHFKSFYFYFIIGYIGIFYSHLMMSFYFTLILLPFFIYFRKEFCKKEYLFPFLKAVLFVAIFISPILVSFIENYGGKYLVYKPFYMTSPALVLLNTLHLQNYLNLNMDDWGVQTYFFFSVIVLFLMSVIWLFKNRKKNNFYFYMLLAIFLCIFLTTSLFPWRSMPDMFLMIQFPWRFLTFLLIFVSLCAPICIKWFTKKEAYFLLFVSVFLLLEGYPMLTHIRDRKYEVGEGSLSIELATGNMGEYFPIEYLEKKDAYFYNREALGLVVLGKTSSTFEPLEASFPSYRFEIKDASQTKVEFPRIYYKGYELHKGDKKYPIKRSQNGLIEATIVEDGIYTLTYTKTILKRVIIVFKYSFLVGIVIWIGVRKILKNKKSV